MSETFDKVRALVGRAEVKISDHGYDEMADEDILAREVLAGVSEGIVVEDYPIYAKGPSVLVLQRDQDQRPIHVVWGIPKGLSSPAVVVTAYRPNPDLWSEDFTRRKT
ncbi:MAG: DUF4258 domain-containing protein [Chloroflexota bacterium]